MVRDLEIINSEQTSFNQECCIKTRRNNKKSSANAGADL